MDILLEQLKRKDYIIIMLFLDVLLDFIVVEGINIIILPVTSVHVNSELPSPTGASFTTLAVESFNYLALCARRCPSSLDIIAVLRIENGIERPGISSILWHSSGEWLQTQLGVGPQWLSSLMILAHP